jgi:hypothetical protein
MKKLALVSVLAFTAFAAHAQQPSIADIEAAKRDRLMDILAAKSAGNGNNQVTDNQPEQDCLGAITVCQSIYIQPNSYVGEGSLDTNEINNLSSCLGAGELNGVWYKIVAAGQGNLGFNITPNSESDDYDWAVYDLTYNPCGSVFTMPQLEISCNFSGSYFPTATTGPNGGPNPQDEPLIPVLPGHVYYIYISNFSNTQSGYTLDFAPSSIPIGNCSFVYGNIYYDNDQNCQRNGNDFGLGAQIIYATPGPFYSLTDYDGFYTLALPQTLNATYYISSIPINGELELVCPSPETYRTVTITNLDSVYTGIDFAYFGDDNGNSPCPIIQVSTATNVHRICCPNNRYVQVCNYGSGPYTNGILTLNYLDNYIDPTSATLPYTQNGNSIELNLPTIGIGECITITVTEVVTDTSALGESACVEAVVGPVPACTLPNNLWDGSNLIVTGQCAVDTVHFTITNNGIGNMAQSEVYELYNENNLVDNGTFILQAGQSQTLSYAATGNLLTMRVNQSDYNPNNSNPCSFVSNCGPEMPPSLAYNLLTLGDEPEYIDVDCSPIVNAYDPNDKSATPIGTGVQHFVSPTDEIQYKIRFQNLGTGAANKVIIVDTLHYHLDPATLQLGASSHTYAAELIGNNVLKFIFNNIELPPASQDEAGSMGVVTYSIKQRWGLPVNYYFDNTAYIYFDFNSAIVTNTVFHNVKDNVTGIAESTAGNIVAELYPNPADNSFTIKLDALKTGQGYNMQLFTSTGSLVRDIKNVKSVENTVDVSALATGLYYYRIVTTDGKTAAGRFVKE